MKNDLFLRTKWLALLRRALGAGIALDVAILETTYNLICSAFVLNAHGKHLHHLLEQRMADDPPDPTCDKCGAPVTTGLMAVICPYAEQCAFWPEDKQSQDFIRKMRGPVSASLQRSDT